MGAEQSASARELNANILLGSLKEGEEYKVVLNCMFPESEDDPEL